LAGTAGVGKARLALRAAERLDESGESQAVRRPHAEYFVHFAERAEPELRLAGYCEWCLRLELEMDNLRTALAWALGSGEVEWAAGQLA
jgi:predicted ATPase